MSELMNRRQMFYASGTVASTLLFRIHGRAAAAPTAKVKATKVISMRPHLYHGWPTLTRRHSGELLVVCCGGREAHVCPFGWVELMRSKDEGRSWSWPRVLLDSSIDERDAGVLETAKGTVLVTTFTSLGYESILKRAEKIERGQDGAWPEERLRRWQAAHQRISAPQREALLGSWMIRSTDGGVTWSAAYRCPVNSPHGPIQLSDGRLLYAGKQIGYGGGRIGVCESTDEGQRWRWLAEIPSRSGDSHEHYHELHVLETAEGRLVAHIRNHNEANLKEILQTESFDGGKTWSVPHPIGVWGEPSHLLRLNDGRLLMTYGHRRKPFGNQARISEDGGHKWSEPIIISGDGTSWDLGYPSTAQLEDGSLLTVWYEAGAYPRPPGSAAAVLRQARWVIGS